MKHSSLKSIEKKLERKNAELQNAVETRKELEIKIRGLKEEIATMQSAKLEYVFQNVKKAILKENLSVTPEAVSGMLDTLRNSQGDNTDTEKHSSMETEPVEKDELLGEDDFDENIPLTKEDLPKAFTSNFESSRLP